MVETQEPIGEPSSLRVSALHDEAGHLGDGLTVRPLTFSAFPGDGQRDGVASKLDVLRANQINLFTRIALVSLSIGLIWVVFHIIAFRTFLLTSLEMFTKDGITITVDDYKMVPVTGAIEGAVTQPLFAVSLVLPVVYSLRVFRNNTREVTQDQILVAIQILINMLSVLSFPLMVAVR